MAKVDQIRAKAAEFFQKGDFAKAVNEYKKVLELEPGNASTYNFIGDAYVKLSNVGEAVSSYLEAVRGYSTDALYNNAIAVCKKILRVNKDDPEVYKTLGDLYIQQGLVNEAITNLLEYAERKIKQGKSEEAFPVYHQIVELNPQNLAVRSKLAEMYLAQKKIAEASEEFSQLAKAYRDQGRVIEAESLEARVRGMRGETPPAQSPAQPEVRPDAIIEELSQQRSEAHVEKEPTPELMVDKEPEPPKEEETVKQDWATNIELGDLLVEIGSTQEALDQYHTAANGYMNDGNVGKAVEVYKKIANLQPLELRSRQKLVEIALQDNQQEALIEAYLGLAECLHRRELREQAAAVYQKVLEIDPVNENALESLSLLLPEMPEGAFEMPGMEIHQETAQPQAAPLSDISFSELESPADGFQQPAPEPSAWQPEPAPAEAPPAWEAPAPAEPEYAQPESFMHHGEPQPEEPQFHGQPAQPEAGDDVHWGREIVEGGRQSRVKFSVADEEPATAPGAQEEFLSLQDILAEFKEGVYQSINQEDFQGHYDLGIAYKEMGLVEEAIAEFQIASKGEKERLKAFEMLGLCFLERGEPRFAIKQLERGISTPGYSDEDYIGLRYNLAQAYEQAGEIPNAVKTLEDIYATDVNFKDVGQRLQSLRASLVAAAPPKPAPVAAPPPPRPGPQAVQQPPVRPVPQPPAPAPQAAPAARPAPQVQAPPVQRPPAPPSRPVVQPAVPVPQYQAAPEPQPEVETAPKPKPIPSKLKKPEKQRISYV